MAVTRSKRPNPASQQRSAKSKRSRPAPQTTSETSDERLCHHLFKSEPESRIQNGHEMKFSIDDLIAEPDCTAHWDGVRNYEARNCMQRMKNGDLAFFYHSNTKKSKPAIVAIVQVVKQAYPDHTAFDSDDPHYDPKSDQNAPRWFMVDVRFVRKLPRCVTLDEIKQHPQLQQMALVKRGRISVQDVTRDEWDIIVNMSETSP